MISVSNLFESMAKVHGGNYVDGSIRNAGANFVKKNEENEAASLDRTGGGNEKQSKK
jgi:hypothetical protein